MANTVRNTVRYDASTSAIFKFDFHFFFFLNVFSFFIVSLFFLFVSVCYSTTYIATACSTACASRLKPRASVAATQKQDAADAGAACRGSAA
jgi:hypothetical protein